MPSLAHAVAPGHAPVFKAITRNVWLLSLVSLFNDAASELLIPIMPK